MRRSIVALSAIAIVASACSSGGGDGANPPDTGLEGTAVLAALVRYDSCDALTTSIRREASSLVGPYGFDTGGSYSKSSAEIGVAAGREAAGAPSADTNSDGGAPTPSTTVDGGQPGVDYSTTNVQEQGVDEPDMTKTDGKTLYVVVGDKLRVIDISGGAPVEAATMTLANSSDQRLLLDGSRLLVLSSGGGHDYYGPDYAESAPGSSGSASASPGDPSSPTITTVPQTTVPGTAPSTTVAPTTQVPTTESTTQPSTTESTTTTVVQPQPDWSLSSDTTMVTALDVSDPANPTLVAQTLVEGSLLDARMIDGIVRIVTSSTPHDLDFVYPSSSGGEKQAQRTNVEIIESTSADDWLPRVQVMAGPGAGEGDRPLVECASVAHTEQFAGLSMLSVSTVDLRGDAVVDTSMTTSIQADGENVYASSRHLYVATNRFDPQNPATETAIHEFDLSGNGEAQYLASGSVRGVLLNQFSMSEVDDVLRVATTDSTTSAATPVPEDGARSEIAPGDDPVIGMPAPRRTPATESFVTTLRRNGKELNQLGQVGGLGKGEQIRSVRFMGTTGYVVTFRQTDPLYTIDLSNPASPAVVGELKIPGYSSYLHPVGDGRLVGIGQDATDQGRTRGLQVALFDVSDPADPRQIQKYTIPGGYSDAESDHHAFLWWSPEHLLLIPVEDYGDTSGMPGGDYMGMRPPFIGAVGLDITDDGIDERGRIEHRRSTEVPEDYDDYYYRWIDDTQIMRMVVVGDSVLSISPSGMASSSISTLTPRWWLAFA